MGKTIRKYDITTADTFTLLVPSGATELCVQMQNDAAFLWILVDPESPPIEKTYRVFGTGHQIPESHGPYIGTFQRHSGGFPFVWHLFAEASTEVRGV